MQAPFPPPSTTLSPLPPPPPPPLIPRSPLNPTVANRLSGEVYLEGELERGVVPEDCAWTHCGGVGEEGCVIYLRKMNLEVLQR
jgi:hypothetical protein